ncbi:type IX secretion system PorP/SprF family membrane protein [Chitinophaga dinghuensis]|uniref:Type IX secretion system PorP/SprF family membrane protein n=1 Tax=Chitinophaga dinghuensis TaxID=1539050 RepID=A0A327VJZ0_9BACT|nr:PorP/SprF family type IX secretion system membrane protein [Chitinophaga dinghuensis]RAJ75024.1 type IX secretion system PorP/SprF family membrane protein [Chitinophaga dinghuensis]
MRNIQFIRFVVISIVFTVCQLYNAYGQDWSKGTAPLQPLASQYFQNQYLANPAFAGIDTGLHINLSYRGQWSDVPGSPVTKAGTADYYVGNRVGAGLNVFNDKAGLINRTKVALTYAYHLPLNASGKDMLHFGLSLGINAERLDKSAIIGETNDPTIGGFNRRDNYFEVDYGMAYTNHNLTLQAAVPNIMNYLRKDENKTVDMTTVYAAASYKIELSDAVPYIEPKVCFRGVRGYDNLVDIGANVVFLQKYLNVFGMYHTSKNFTVGAGLNYKSIAGFQVMYTTQTAGLKNYTSGALEIGLVVHLFR